MLSGCHLAAKGFRAHPTLSLRISFQGNSYHYSRYYRRFNKHRRYHKTSKCSDGGFFSPSETYSTSVYLKSSMILGGSALLALSPFIIEKIMKRANIVLTDEEIIDFEKSKLNAEKRIDYERAFREQNLKPEEPKTVMDIIRHHTYVAYRFTQLTILFVPVALLAPLAALLKFVRPIWWNMLKFSLEAAGGCWIKLGQWASTRPDLFPEYVIAELGNLQNSCPSHSFSFTKKTIEEGYGAALEDIFEEFEVEPIASGAIAQVHKAKLKIDGQELAVKILHPGVRRQILVDLNMMHLFARIVSLIPSTEWMSLDEAILQFSTNMASQISMRTEARNLMRFGQNFEGDPNVTFPKVIDNMTTDNVLVETFEHGMSLNEFLKTNTDLNQHKAIAKVGLNSYLKMILVHNFIHADLHPGNILIRKKPVSDDLQVVLLDTGFVAELSDQDWFHFKQLFKCIVQGDGKGGARLMVEHARQTKISKDDREKFVSEMDVLFNEIRNQKISHIDIGLFLTNMLNVVRKYRVKIESNFATLCVATVILEGIGRQLDPEINILDQSIPFLLYSDKATVEDRMIFLREKVKDEFEHQEQGKKVALWEKMYNVVKPALS